MSGLCYIEKVIWKRDDLGQVGFWRTITGMGSKVMAIIFLNLSDLSIMY